MTKKEAFFVEMRKGIGNLRSFQCLFTVFIKTHSSNEDSKNIGL
jgi:hypothetical protein